MKTIRYRAAGGVVIQQGVLDALDSRQAYVLLLDRPSRREMRLPKGHIDADEGPKETALRETREETGYADLEIVSDLGSRTVEFDYQGSHYVRDEHYYLLRLGSGRRTEQPVGDVRQFRVLWVPLDGAAERVTYESEQEFVRAAIRKYRALS